MIGYINNQLQDIAGFLDSTKKNIDTRNKAINDNVKDLLEVMTSLKALDEKREDIELVLDRVEEVLRPLTSGMTRRKMQR